VIDAGHAVSSEVGIVSHVRDKASHGLQELQRLEQEKESGSAAQRHTCCLQ
jgi:hypothetical protein